MFSHAAARALRVAGASAAPALFLAHDSRARSEPAPAVQRRLTAVADAAIEAQLFQPGVPWPQWDANWDHRELDSRGRMRSRVRPTSAAPRRHVILIRHGQYDETSTDDRSRVLTPLGREQALAAGKRVRELLNQQGGGCRGVYSSRLARAKETADIVDLPGRNRTRGS